MAAGAAQDRAQSWYHEKESAWLYGVVAAAEPDPVKRALFRKLARHRIPGGLRMLLIGGGAGVVAWGIGKLLGASIA